MKVDKINAYKAVFKKHLEVTQAYNELYKYDALNNFRANWNLGELDLRSIYDKSFQSAISGRLWGGSVNSAREMMLRFIEKDKEFVRSMFRDLYNEDKDLAMRINRFKFHCDELLSKLQEDSLKLSHHYHDDSEVVMYLAFNAPERYPLYNYAPFRIMMERLEAKNVPEEWEVDRFLKLSKGLYTLLSRDEELLSLHKDQIKAHYEEPTMIIVHDFMVVCSQGSAV